MLAIRFVKNNAVVADKCIVAESFFVRARGLIGRAALASGEGMLFPRCNSVHMWFMSTPIDIVFLRKVKNEASPDGASKFVVTSVHPGVRPWKVLPVSDFRASLTLELRVGAAAEHGLMAGDELCTS